MLKRKKRWARPLTPEKINHLRTRLKQIPRPKLTRMECTDLLKILNYHYPRNRRFKPDMAEWAILGVLFGMLIILIPIIVLRILALF